MSDEFLNFTEKCSTFFNFDFYEIDLIFWLKFMKEKFFTCAFCNADKANFKNDFIDFISNLVK